MERLEGGDDGEVEGEEGDEKEEAAAEKGTVGGWLEGGDWNEEGGEGDGGEGKEEDVGDEAAAAAEEEEKGEGA